MTPGPWKLVDRTICDKDGYPVIETLSGFTADLTIAAAAPDMLAALEEFCRDHAKESDNYYAMYFRRVIRSAGREA